MTIFGDIGGSEILLALVVAAAHTIETVTGFGGTIIALAAGVHFIPVETLIVALLAVAWVQSAWILLKDWKYVAAGIITRSILPLAAAGGVFGFLLRSSMDTEGLKILLGLFVISVSSLEIYRLWKTLPSHPLNPWTGRLVLSFGGFFHGLFASGGPAIVYYASRVIEGKKPFRATLAALWITLNTFLLAAAALSGNIDKAAAVFTISALPGLAAGIILGEYLHNRVPERLFLGIVSGLLLITGIILLLR